MSDDAISQGTITKLAQLARLTVSAGQQARFAKDLAAILEAVSALEGAVADAPSDGPGMPAGRGIADVAAAGGAPGAPRPAMPLRADQVAETLGLAGALANAPARLGDGFMVPAVMSVGA